MSSTNIRCSRNAPRAESVLCKSVRRHVKALPRIKRRDQARALALYDCLPPTRAHPQPRGTASCVAAHSAPDHGQTTACLARCGCRTLRWRASLVFGVYTTALRQMEAAQPETVTLVSADGVEFAVRPNDAPDARLRPPPPARSPAALTPCPRRRSRSVQRACRRR